MVDVVYIAASTNDARFTRICVASVRRFHPDVPICLLVGGPLQRGLAGELHRHWNVGVADFPRENYGWGFVKLEPLFRPPGERFLVLDSDTVITGPVLELAAQHEEDFIVDDETPEPQRAREIYWDPVRAAQEGNPLASPLFLFNSGQWFGRSGLLTREHFRGLVEWSWPRRLVRPSVFMGGDQGILNYVVNEQLRLGRLSAARIPLMRWPGHGLDGLSAESVANRSCPTVVIHWAGMKRTRQRKMLGADILDYYERRYYERLPNGSTRMLVDRCRSVLAGGLRRVEARVRALR
jgi:hypothetical protein